MHEKHSHRRRMAVCQRFAAHRTHCGLLPGDVLARYYRAKGDRVFFVSGSDCHGTPVTLRARQENSTPEEVSNRYHEEFCAGLRQLGFSYDLYGKTSDAFHVDFVTAFHKKLYRSGLVYEKWAPQAFCATCEKTLTDRLVTGRCPTCGQTARGDQCDACGSVLEAEALGEPRCAACGEPITFTRTKQLYIAISRLKDVFRAACLRSGRTGGATPSRSRARYLDEVAQDRAITRDLDWGIPVPMAGYEDKRIYIWAENVLGYLSASCEVARRLGVPFEEVWGKNARHYYVHGKDNIPFHSIILPALLIAHGDGLRLGRHDIERAPHPEGRKISTSQNWAVWAKDIAREHHPTPSGISCSRTVRKSGTRTFPGVNSRNGNNSELLGAYGNLVNRTLAFLVKYGGGTVPEGTLDDTCKSAWKRV